MKKLIFILSLLVMVSHNIYSQWHHQYSGTTDNLYQVFFVNENVGYICTSHNIYKSNDSGNQWTFLFSMDSIWIKDIFFLNENLGWLVFQDYTIVYGGVYKTTDGGITWNLQMTTVQDMNMLSIQFVDSLNGFCLGDYSMAGGRLYKTIDGGQTWSDTLTSINLAEGMYFIDKYTGWVAGGTIEKTTDSGVTWTLQLNIDPKYFSYIQFVNNDTGWAFTRWGQQIGRLYKTTNTGQSWFLQYDFPFTRIRFVDETYGWAVAGSNIYITTNGGDNWEIQYNDISNNLYEIYFINQSKGWIVGDNGTILYTDNGGIPVELISFSSSIIENDLTLNWQTSTETNNQGFQIERRKTQDERSEDWENIGFVNGNGTTTEPQSYSFVDEKLLAGKYQYRLKQIDFDGTFEYSNTIEVGINSPTKFSLEQNYPNPFNPSTKISWQSPVGSWQTLKVYDILGKEIATLVNEEKPAGSFNVEFNASHLASGIYYYQLRAGDFVETKKMVLMK